MRLAQCLCRWQLDCGAHELLAAELGGPGGWSKMRRGDRGLILKASNYGLSRVTGFHSRSLFALYQFLQAAGSWGKVCPVISRSA